MRPNSNDQGFLASYFEFVDCNFIKEPRPNVAKGHERVFLRTLLSNFPSICSRQRIADSIAGFFVDRYLAFKRRTRRGPNKSLVIYPHPFLNFTRIDLGHGSGRAHSKGRHNGCKCGVEFQSNHFPNWLVTLLIEKFYHVNTQSCYGFFLGSAIAQAPSTATRGRTCTKF